MNDYQGTALMPSENTTVSVERYIPASRRGKRAVVAHVRPAVAWQLKKLALDRGTTVQKLLEESLADLFEKYHLPQADF